MKSETSPIILQALGSILLAGVLASTSLAGDQATGALSGVSLGGGVFAYTITLENTGTNDLETFWYSWLPGEDFMPVSPTNIQSPAEWTDIITGGGPNNGYAIQWVTSTSALAPGFSFSFTFDSTATPAVLAGASPFYPNTPIGTSVIYSGGPFSDAGSDFIVSSVPEPSSLACLVFAGTGFAVARRRALRRLRC